MHILLIHQAYAGPQDPGGTRHHELASYLAARGHRTTIIASEVSYLTGARVAAGTTEDTPGIRVIRLPGSDLHKSFAARATSFAHFSAGALRAALRIPDVDVVWGTTPPLPQLLPAWLASLRAPGGLVVEERDLWPEFAIGMGVLKDGAVSDAALAFKRWVYRRARRVVINSPGFLPFLRGYGVPEDKIQVIPNGVDPLPFDPEADGAEQRRAWGAGARGERFVVLYAGALGPANALEVVLEAAVTLRATRALFVLVGDGKARAELEHRAAELALDNVLFVPAQPKERVPGLIAAADACLASLRDIPLFRTTYPNKVFDYMAGGRPVLLQIDGVIREVVEQAQAGLFAAPGDARALAAAVRQMMDQPEAAREMGRRGRVAVCERFDRRLQGRQIEALFAELVPVGRRASGTTDDAGTTRAPAAALGGAASAAGRAWEGRVSDAGLRVKRLLDLAIALPLLALAALPMLGIALVLRCTDGAPVLFRQTRPGRRTRPFTLLKFRAMRAGSAADELRLTRLGRVLRTLSLDELPQLWNVLRGEMSLVGPRPLLPQYVARYNARQMRRHDVPPGITGLAQVEGRNALSWEQRFELDAWYVEHRNLALDLRLIARTVLAVALRRGVSASGHATMPEFLGSAPSATASARCERSEPCAIW